MSLLAPLGLLALLTLPVIVILHMLRARRRRVIVPSLIIWQRLPTRPAPRWHRRLRWSWLLALHLLVALLLGLALAQPQATLPWIGTARSLALIIDTSTSMAMREGGNSRLELAQRRAASLIGAARGADQLVIISAGPRAHLVDHGTVADRARLLAALTSLQVEGAGADLGGALTIAETMLIDQPGTEIIFISDGALPPPDLAALRLPMLIDQPGTEIIFISDGALPPPDLAVLRLPMRIEIVGAPQPNRAIVTLAARPGAAGAIHVYARLTNHSDRPFRGPARLFVDDQLRLTEAVTIQARSMLELAWTLPGPARMIRLELNGNDGLPLDDTASVQVSGTRPTRALLVADHAPALARALQAIPELNLTTIAPAEYTPSNNADLTIFVNVLPDRWPTGGVLVIDPPAGSQLLAVAGSRTVEAGATITPTGEALLRDINLAGIAWGRLAQIELPAWLTPLALSDGVPLIMRGRFDQSELAVWNVNLANSALTSRLAFPLLVTRTVRDLTPPPWPAVVTLGEPLLYHADPRATRLELISPSGELRNITLIPRQPALLEFAIPGNHQIRELAGDRLIAETVVPVNAGALGEADPTPRLTSATVSRPAATVTAQQATAQPLWSWLVIAALIALAGEWLYMQRRATQEAL